MVLCCQCLCCLCGDYVTSVEFADDHTLVSADGGGKAKVWSIATGEEKTEALVSPEVEDDEKGDAGGAGARAPVAFFRAPSPIQALDCRGAEIALGCKSGSVRLLRAAVLLT